MYEQHFGFDKRPFGTTATGADVFVGPQTARTIAGLRNAVTSQDAVITVSGQVGTGKTTLIHRSIDALGMKYKTVRVGRMKIDSSEVLESLLVVLGVRDRPTGTMQRLAALRDTLKQHQDRGVRIFVVIEDAMRTGVDSLAEIEALTAADAGESDGANIIVMGDEGLAEFMRDPKLVQLQQRVRQRHTVLPLSVAELRGYLVHSFRRAGGSFEKVFDTDAAPLLHQLGGGIPRLTNNLVEATLAAAANQGLARIPATLIASVALDDFALSSEGFEFTAVEESAPERAPDTNVETAATGPDEALSAAPANPAVVSGNDVRPPVVEEADEDIPHLIQDTLPEIRALSPLEFAPEDEDATVLRDLDADDEMEVVDEKVTDSTTQPPAEPEVVPAPLQFDETQFPADNIESFVAPLNVHEEKLPPAGPDADAQAVQFDETQFPADNIESFVAAPPNVQEEKRPPQPETRIETEIVPVLADDSTLGTGHIPTLTDETGVRSRDVPELTLDTRTETHDVPPTRPETLAKTEPPTEIVPELSVDDNDEPTLVPVPDAFPDLVEEESGVEESPEWDCDPTYAEFKPDLEALDKAMSMAADGPLDATGVSLIDTYTIDDIRGAEYIAVAKTAPPGGVAASAPSSPKLIGPFAEPTEEAVVEQVVELDQVAAKIGGSQSLEEVDDKLAETLFGTEFCFVAEQVMQLESESELSSDDLQLEPEPEPEPEPTPRPAVIPVAREVSVDALESANDSRSDEPAAEKQKIVQSLYTDLHPSLRNAAAAKPASAAKSAEVDSMPKSIEDQIDLSMTRTLQALEVPDEATDEQSKTGFFNRFRRS